MPMVVTEQTCFRSTQSSAGIVEWYTTTLIKTPGNAPRDTNTPAIPQEIYTLDLIDQPGGAAKVAQTLDEARQRNPKATLFSEAVVNFVGILGDRNSIGVEDQAGKGESFETVRPAVEAVRLVRGSVTDINFTFV